MGFPALRVGALSGSRACVELCHLDEFSASHSVIVNKKRGPKQRTPRAMTPTPMGGPPLGHHKEGRRGVGSRKSKEASLEAPFHS